MEVGTLAGRMDELTLRGFTEHFMLRDGRLRAAAGGKRSGLRGTLADAFGVYSDPLLSVFMEDVALARTRARTPVEVPP